MDVLVNEITGHSICKHSDGCSAFLIRGEANLSEGTLFALEIAIVADHPLSNTVEKMPTYTETTAEFLMFEQRVLCVKVVLPKKEISTLSRLRFNAGRCPEMEPRNNGHWLLRW